MRIETSSIRRLSAFVVLSLLAWGGPAWAASPCNPNDLTARTREAVSPDGIIDFCAQEVQMAEANREAELAAQYAAEDKRRAEQAKLLESEQQHATSSVEKETAGSQVSSSQTSAANTCSSQATAAVSACSGLASVIRNAEASVGQASSQISSSSSTINACSNLSRTAGSEVSKLQSARGSCSSAVSQCTSTCSSAVSALSSVSGTSAYTTATSGKAKCSGASSSMANVDSAIAQLQSAKARGDSCVAQFSGSTSNDNANNTNSSTTTTTTTPPTSSGAEDVLSSASGIPEMDLNSSFQESIPSSSSYLPTTSSTTPRLQQKEASLPKGYNSNSSVNLDQMTERERQNYLYEATKRKEVPKQANNLKQMGQGSGSGQRPQDPIEMKDKFRKASDSPSNVYQGDWGGGNRGRVAGNGGGYPDAPSYTSGKMNAMAKNAAQMARQQAGDQVDLKKFLPGENRFMRVGGGRTPADIGSEFAGPHTNMFRSINGSFQRLSQTLIVPNP